MRFNMKLVSPTGLTVDAHASKVESMLNSGWKKPEVAKLKKPESK